MLYWKELSTIEETNILKCFIKQRKSKELSTGDNNVVFLGGTFQIPKKI